VGGSCEQDEVVDGIEDDELRVSVAGSALLL
jgi:hypothetical protein